MNVSFPQGFVDKAKQLSQYAENLYKNGTMETRRFGLGLSKSAALIGLVMSVFTSVIGYAFCGKGVGVVIGFPMLMIGTVGSFISYNTYKTIQNLEGINQNPQKFKKFYGPYDQKAIRNHLQKGTLGFEVPIDWIVKFICKNQLLG